MPNTTNFNWPTPADTDLVKDGAAAIRNLGNGVDTSLVDLKGGTTGQILSKASNADMDFAFVTPNVGDLTEVQAGVGISVASGTGPIPIITNSSTDLITTAGDLLYGTAADTVARLGIGTAGQVLKVNSGATAPEWGAAASGGGMTLISRTTFSNVASQAFDDVFTSSYDNYYILIDSIYAATSADDLLWQFRYAGPTTQTADYYSSNFGYTNANALATSGVNAGSAIILSTDTGSSARPTTGQLYVTDVGNASEYPLVNGLYFNPIVSTMTVVGGQAFETRTYTGFLLKSASTNITGTVSIFGVNKS
jgi:hypothetical protein